MNIANIVIPLTFGISGAGLFFFVPSDVEHLRRHSLQRIGKIRDRNGVTQRLRALGQENDYEKFRVAQVCHSLSAGFAAYLIFSAFQKSFTAAAPIAILCGFVMFLVEDRKLSAQVKKQRVQIEAEFASTIEMLTLALSAGETPLGAVTRIAQRSEGLFSVHLRMVVNTVRSGKSFQVSLDEMARRIESPQIRRFIDALVIAISRGAPLIDLLHIHVAEARATQKNLILDRAGKAEMSMMVPVVFLILPISILFALWPSLTHLNLFAS